MSNTSTMNIKKVHRNFICGRWRDTIQENFNVTISFTRGREYEHGDFQTMVIKGSIKNMNMTRNEISRIIDEQDVQFRLRQSKRHNFRRHNSSPPPLPVLVKQPTTTKKNLNPFAILDTLDDQNQQQNTQTKKQIIKIPVVKSRTPVCTMNFASMAAKAKPVPTKNTLPNIKKVEKNVTFFQHPTQFRDNTVPTSYTVYEDNNEDDNNEDDQWEDGWAWGES